MKVVIAGAGAVGTFVASDLRAANHEVLLIEKNPDLAARLRPTMDVQWFVGDACEVSNLQDAGIADADVMVAATGEDQVNLVISLLAKQEFAVPRVVARVNEPRNKWLFNETWGVDVSVSTPHLLTALIEEAVSVGSLVRLLEFEGGEATLIEVTLADDSPAAGRTIAELGVPRDASIVAVVRRNHVVVPRGDTLIQVGDEVLALTTPASEDAVKQILIGADGGGGAARAGYRSS
ncbi:MAG TPA: NAD-binding protein [Acidimicrobiales bacterium]|nr:NAD-binding protein [Acidimicrobiales bacterium]